ncbi:phosphatidate phosphatase lpin2 [Plakobranchus ocellatus]|uniref:phosphatidate phosphatase n=1 Tax=Plakobranchus ocellatus TaxID=259542 RepID=A0AAV4BU73_9GAST|nr:phosphatidate phosphatase lpin2 [Plakobranchus ocellatus]
MSFAFVGRIVQSLKGFYNGINPATLTGAIDVVIVKQPDGTYHSSPFHVRFGKLGVLRSREKVVDIEINGEPIDLHMKLGEAGEAFFVQEIESEEEEDVPAYLATSPLPDSESIMEAGVKELHRQAQEEVKGSVEVLPESAAYPSHYNAYSVSSNSSGSMGGSPRGPNKSGVHSGTAALSVEIGSNGKPRRKVLRKKKQHQKVSQQNQQQQLSTSHHHHYHHHHHQKSGSARAGLRSVSMPEGVSEEAVIFDMEESTSDESVNSYDDQGSALVPGDALAKPAPLRNFSGLQSTSSPDVPGLDLDFNEENELKGLQLQGTTSYRRMSSLGNSSFLTTPFSDPETSPIASPRTSRPSTPKSDTEVDKQHVEESQTSALMENSATWAWGMFPTNLEAACPQQQQQQLPEEKEQVMPETVDAGQTVVQVVEDHGAGDKDSDRTAKSSSGFMSIWNKSSSSTQASSRTTDALEGIYLDDLTSMDDPEMARIYLGQPREKEEDTESGRGQSLPQSPNSVEGAIGGPSVSFTMSEVRHLGPVALSLCGGLGDPETLTLDKFMQKVVTFEDLAQNPNITSNPDLVVKIHDKFYNWTTAGPMVLSQIVFHKQLPDPAVKDLEKEHMPKKKKKKGWFSWGRSAEVAEEGGASEATTTPGDSSVSATTTTATGQPVPSPDTAVIETPAQAEGEVHSSPVTSPGSTPPNSNKGTPRKHRPHRVIKEETTTSTETDTDLSEKEVSSGAFKSSPPPQNQQEITKKASAPTTPLTDATSTATATSATFTTTTTILSTETTKIDASGSAATSTAVVSTSVTIDLDVTPPASPDPLDDDELELLQQQRHRHSSVDSGSGKPKREKFIKSLRLSSEQISKMGLREGHNEIMFSVTTQYQGTTRCLSNVYLWNHDDKIVISDIDGTITKSDVLGQIMPIIGRDWSQSGVAQLFTRIDQNGYKLIYLSARAIGQSRSTKDMLKSIRQGGLVLPNGPLFLNPTSLFSAFHREVILKNPEEFKISCLKDIADLFPSSPFIAGFGNKLNDVIAYRALDIPRSRIFTINPQGQLRHDLSLTFQSSYTGMSDLVDHLFPCRDHVDRGAASEFTGVSYWRNPIPVVSDLELALVSGGSSGKSASVVSTTAPTGSTSTEPAAVTKLDLQIEAPKQ